MYHGCRLAKHLEQLPNELRRDIVLSRSVPIIGAGFSSNAELPRDLKMPLWNELGKHFAESISRDYPFSTPVDALSAYEQQFTRTKLIEELHSELHIVEAKPSVAHLAFARVPFDIVITTNFDFLLERAYEVSQYNTCTPVIEESQLSVNFGERTTKLLKIHGDLHHPNNLVATEDDYDSFIDKYPLLSTYISNLLISRTPLFIGYSLDDPDFRQLWQIITNRLGKLHRPAYAIMVDAKPVDIARFQRRNVTVISLQGAKRDYPTILASLFDEIKGYWDQESPKVGQVTNEETLSELSLPLDTRTRLCFFAIPSRMQTYYKTYYFPSAERLGFAPVNVMDVVLPGESLVPTISTLIAKSILVIVDASSDSSLSEAGTAIAMGRRIVLIAEQGTRTPKRLAEYPLIRRPIFPTPPGQKDLDTFERVMRELAQELLPSLREEPMRLLQAQEPRAAVISAFSLLEAFVRERVLGSEKDRFFSLGRMLEIPTLLEFITPGERDDLRGWISERNKLVHTDEKISLTRAREIVNGVLGLLHRLRQHFPS